MSAFKFYFYFYEDWYCMHEAYEGQWMASVRVHCRQPRTKMTELEACIAACVCFVFYKLSQLWTMTGKGQTTYRQYAQWLKLLHLGRAMYKLHSRDSGHDMLSPCMCPSLVHACVLPDWQRIVTNPDAIRGLCAMTITSTMCCLLVLAPWRSKERLAASTLGWQQ